MEVRGRAVRNSAVASSRPRHFLHSPPLPQRSSGLQHSSTRCRVVTGDLTSRLRVTVELDAAPQPATMMPRQGYAPTPHSYVPNTSLSATINLDEVRVPPSVRRRPPCRAPSDTPPPTGSEAHQHPSRARPARLPRGALQHHRHARRARKGLPQRCHPRGRVHGDLRALAAPVQGAAGRRGHSARV